MPKGTAAQERRRPDQLVDCRTADEVKAWLRVHADTWHYGQVLATCGLCQLALARLAMLQDSASPS